jgi:hypothetical protein
MGASAAESTGIEVIRFTIRPNIALLLITFRRARPARAGLLSIARSTTSVSDRDATAM